MLRRGDQRVYLRQTRGGRACWRSTISFPQYSDGRTNLHHRLSACRSDRPQRQACLLWCIIECVEGQTRLDTHRSNGMCQDIMQLASDSQALLRHLSSRLPDLRFFYLMQPLSDLFKVTTPVSHDFAKQYKNGKKGRLLCHLDQHEKGWLVLANHYDKQTRQDIERRDEQPPA
jgi:hypothetical protein